MKKLFLMLPLLLVMVLSLALFGCGETGDDATGGDENTETEGDGGEKVERQLRDLPENVKFKVLKEEHTVEYTDGETEIVLDGTLYTPDDPSTSKFPAVILSHGFNGHSTDFPSECSRLAKRGYIAYAFDFCGAQANGKSTGRTENDYTPLTMKRDLVAVFKHMQALPNVDGTQVFLWGGSQGGFVSALAAADDEIKDDVAGLALYFPAFNIPDDWHGAPEKKTPLMGYYINADFIRSVQELDPFAVIPAYTGDVCIVWGTEDALVKRTYIDQAVEAYGEERTALTVIEGAGHGFGGKALTTAIDTVMAFLEARTYEPI